MANKSSVSESSDSEVNNPLPQFDKVYQLMEQLVKSVCPDV